MILSRIAFSALFGILILYGEGVDDALDGFEDESTLIQAEDPSSQQENAHSVDDALAEGFDEKIPATKSEQQTSVTGGFNGELTQKVSYSWDNDAPHDGFNSFNSELFLDYEHKFKNGYKFKINAKAYYDAIYSFKGREDFMREELDELESEVELFDAYLEGKIAEKLDFKIGRQVVVWGRSDTIRVTDILNPLDNRMPGMVDIEDLRLPVTMAKLDYFIGDWRITPIAILEQRFSKNPPFGSDFYPFAIQRPADENYHDVTWALSVGGEFEGWDINFYAADVRDDDGFIDMSDAGLRFEHDKVQMFGTALNILTGSWLFKTELAHFEGLKYTTVRDKELSRTDALIGVEYNGIADTMISYDFVTRNIHDYDRRLLAELNPLNKHEYQHAFRISSDFLNAALTANYLISLYGDKLDQGGFQRAWIEYDLADGITLTGGVVDYIGGSVLFDVIKDNDRIFADLSYSF